ncbi:MAG: type 4a pilus biogenesis protein PilO [Phycisphaerales bacterium]|nr:type 4a pilus biogenesis protein PilO [Phycisphaerales bacterium]MCI0630535.1 type 4a pilus biogenesis protein PilO [Phycisphaerales bacterium]MCI0676462.1 type 4a pilus biogenesis protein PilO [Phycisphaerales bacterium]
MNINIPRELAAQAVIVLAVCIGAWIAVVKPRAAELVQLEQTISESSSSLNSMSPETVENLQRKIASVQKRVAQVKLHNQLADDSSRLYGLVMDLADEHRVQVQRLQPGLELKKANAESQFAAMKLDLTVEGRYEAVAAFLEQITNLEAFIRPVSLQITPTTVDGTPTATAEFGCEVLSFALAEPLMGVKAGGADGQP